MGWQDGMGDWVAASRSRNGDPVSDGRLSVLVRPTGDWLRLHRLQGLRGNPVCNPAATRGFVFDGRAGVAGSVRDLALYLPPRGPLAQLGERLPCMEDPGDEPPLKTQETDRPSDRRAATHCATRRAETQKYLPKSTRDLP
jgi:hypothetical protein